MNDRSENVIGRCRYRQGIVFRVAQRPTKTLLTLGTHVYVDLCCVAQETEVVQTEAHEGPQIDRR
jgi:hypothetical protein